jgi:hypothetical protein
MRRLFLVNRFPAQFLFLECAMSVLIVNAKSTSPLSSSLKAIEQKCVESYNVRNSTCRITRALHLQHKQLLSEMWRLYLKKIPTLR